MDLALLCMLTLSSSWLAASLANALLLLLSGRSDVSLLTAAACKKCGYYKINQT